MGPSSFPASDLKHEFNALERAVYDNDILSIKRILGDATVPDESTRPFSLLYLLYEGAANCELDAVDYIDTARFLIARGATQTRRDVNDFTPYEHFAHMFSGETHKYYFNVSRDLDVLALFSQHTASPSPMHSHGHAHLEHVQRVLSGF